MMGNILNYSGDDPMPTKDQTIMLEAASRRDEMYRLYEQGNTMVDIAQRFGITKQRVSEIFKMHGYKARPKSYRKYAYGTRKGIK
jgi:hypothetical protein